MSGFRAGQAPPVEQVDPLQPLKDFAAKLDELRTKSIELMKIADEGDLPALHLRATGIREQVERAQVELTGWVPE